jgi:hypothetical protein
MAEYRITEQLDLGLVYDATRSRLSEEAWKKMLKAAPSGDLSRQEFIDLCIRMKYPAIGFSCDAKPIGGMLFDGQAAHIEVLPEHHGRWGVLWVRCLEWMFSLKDPMEVKIDACNEKALRFMDRNNWQRIHEDEDFVTYVMCSESTLLHRKRSRRD